MDNNVAKGWVEGNAPTYPQGAEVKNNDKELSDLNEVVKDCIAVLEEKIQFLKAIIRYDLLPLISGNKEKVGSLFSKIFYSIVQYPPVTTKLLIYLRSYISTPEVMDLSLPQGYHTYTICVYTNILANDAWQIENKPLLADCATIIKDLGGSFSHYPIENTDCLYSLQLPGKPLE